MSEGYEPVLSLLSTVSLVFILTLLPFVKIDYLVYSKTSLTNNTCIVYFLSLTYFLWIYPAQSQKKSRQGFVMVGSIVLVAAFFFKVCTFDCCKLCVGMLFSSGTPNSNHSSYLSTLLGGSG